MSTASKGSRSIQWMWENDAGSGYNNFDEHLSNLLELIYKCKPTALKREPFIVPYKNFIWEFDFTKMTQTNKENSSSRKIIRVEDGMLWICYRKNNKHNFNVIDSEYASTLNSMNALGEYSSVDALGGYNSMGPRVFKYSSSTFGTFECKITGGLNKYECTNDIVIEKVSVNDMQILKVAPTSSVAVVNQYQPHPQFQQPFLPSGWTRQFDHSSGRFFYVSPTGNSQWEPPPPSYTIPPPPPLSGHGGGSGGGKMRKKKRFVNQNKTYKKRHTKRKTIKK